MSERERLARELKKVEAALQIAEREEEAATRQANKFGAPAIKPLEQCEDREALHAGALRAAHKRRDETEKRARELRTRQCKLHQELDSLGTDSEE